MSLRVWLPLINDTHNQGLLNLPTPWDARSRDTGGKLGQYCYSDNAIYHIENEWLGNVWSLACWVKSSGWGQYNDIILCKNTSSSDSAQFYLSIIGGTQLNIGCNAGSQTLTIGNTFATNTWYHIASTYDGSTLKLYLNGNEVGTKAYVSTQKTGMNNLGIGCRSTNAAGTSATGGANKRTNDIRIYDHCLSPLEVKEISQGLVLHYPLNNGGWGNNNLILNTKVLTPNSSKSTKNCSVRGSAARQLRNDGFYESKCTSAWQGISTWANAQNLAVGQKYTYSFYFYTDGSTKSLSFYPMMYNSGGTRDTSSTLPISVDGSTYQNANARTFGTFSNKTPIRHYVTFEWNSTMNSIIQNGGSIELSIQVHGTFNTGEYGCVYAPKLELGNVVTTWSPAPSDAAGTAFGLNSNQIIDCSGFGHNGTITGGINYSGDTPRYDCSTNYPDSACAIAIGNLSTMVPEGTFTFNIWFKKITGEWSSKNWETIFGGPSGFELELKNSSSNSPVLYAYSWNKGNTTYTLDEWHMLTMVRTSSGTTFYLDGSQVFTGTAGSIPSGNYFIGSWRDSTSQNMRGYVSDFRLYSTALSEDDIKSLYNTSMSIDNLGQAHGFEFIENNQNLINPDLTTWAKENSVTCEFNPETKFYDVDSHRDSSNTSRWGIYVNINVTPSTNYVFSVDMQDNGSRAGIQTYESSTAWPTNRFTSSGTKRYYYYFTSGASDTVGRIYLATIPSSNIVGHFANPFLGVMPDKKSIEKNGVANFGNIVELFNENARITQFGELGANEFIEK